MPAGIYIRTDYHRKRLSEGGKKRFSNPEERLKISKMINRPEVKAKQIASLKKTMNLPEVKAKCVAPHIGSKRTEEHKKAISDWNKKRWSNIENKIDLAEKLKGDKSHFWKGGIYPENKTIRTNFRYKNWKNDVFKRDNWTCQKCGKHGGSLHAHHIKEFNLILSEIREIANGQNIVDLAFKCADLWDINNGITLCKECHYKGHGRKI